MLRAFRNVLEYGYVKRAIELAADRIACLPTNVGAQDLKAGDSDLNRHLLLAIRIPGNSKTPLRQVFEAYHFPCRTVLPYLAGQVHMGAIAAISPVLTMGRIVDLSHGKTP